MPCFGRIATGCTSLLLAHSSLASPVFSIPEPFPDVFSVRHVRSITTPAFAFRDLVPGLRGSADSQGFSVLPLRNLNLGDIKVGETLTDEVCNELCQKLGGPNSECEDASQSRCRCTDGFAFIGQQCVRATPEQCSTNCLERFGPNSLCTNPDNGQCACKDGFVPELTSELQWTTCVKKTDQTCTAYCHTLIGPNAECANNESGDCRCKDGFFPKFAADGTASCEKANPVTCEDFCKKEGGPNAVCGDPVAGTCGCADGYTWSDPNANHVTECVPGQAPPTTPPSIGGWSEWSSCSASCGLGAQTRTCPDGTCPGPAIRACGTDCENGGGSNPPTTPVGPTPESPAPTVEWSEWGSCSATCGNGVQTRDCPNVGECPGPGIRPCSNAC